MHLAQQGLCPIFPGLGSISSTLEKVVTPDPKTCVGPCSEAKVAPSGLPPFLLPHQAYHPKQPQHWQPVQAKSKLAATAVRSQGDYSTHQSTGWEWVGLLLPQGQDWFPGQGFQITEVLKPLDTMSMDETTQGQGIQNQKRTSHRTESQRSLTFKGVPEMRIQRSRNNNSTNDTIIYYHLPCANACAKCFTSIISFNPEQKFMK